MNKSTDHKKELADLHEKALTKFEEYMHSKQGLKEDDHKNLKQQRDKWELAWNELMESLLVLERLEI